ncbi:hypothetical protein DFJ74DRAFT_706772 [Hyaloraphidium curvatum]|nr:hypothetical protein DFJ74DRAFT_706772 [Hyaloraphidium curvatum]
MDTPAVRGLLSAACTVLPVQLLAAILWHAFVAANRGNLRQVDRKTCTCSCWDGGFTQHGESPRSIYFNLEPSVLAVGQWYLAYSVLAALALRRMLEAAWARCLRPDFAFAFAATVYPSFYCLWMKFNYLGLDYSKLWWSQLFFSLTELAAQALLALLADARVAIHPTGMLWPPAASAAVHIARMMADNGVPRGARDYGFLVGDAAVLGVCALRALHAARTETVLPASVLGGYLGGDRGDGGAKEWIPLGRRTASPDREPSGADGGRYSMRTFRRDAAVSGVAACAVLALMAASPAFRAASF